MCYPGNTHCVTNLLFYFCYTFPRHKFSHRISQSIKNQWDTIMHLNHLVFLITRVTHCITHFIPLFNCIEYEIKINSIKLEKDFTKAYPDMTSLQARACARARNHMATGILDLANDDEESVLKFRDLFQSHFCANWHRVRVSSRVFDDFSIFLLNSSIH